jgi:hypothetical protein
LVQNSLTDEGTAENMSRFLKSKTALHKEIRKEKPDWKKVAHWYNGASWGKTNPNYATNAAAYAHAYKDAPGTLSDLS